MDRFEGGMKLEPWAYQDEGPCCERCGLPIDPAFAARSWIGFLCMDCYEELEKEKREEDF